MREKLSKHQRDALVALNRYGEITAYGAEFRLDTLGSLETRGLASASRGLGSMAFPHTSIKWRITPAGRARSASAAARGE